MFRRVLILLWLFSLGDVAARAADMAVVPTAAVERFHSALLANMKGGKAVGFEARKQRLEPIIRDVFDLAAMARVATGSAWQKLSDEERGRVITAFSDWTVATNAANFKEWDGESFTTKGAKDDGKGNIMVETALNLKSATPVLFTYRMRTFDDAPHVVDIFLEGTISQMAMHRSQFAAALTMGGVDNLLKHMHELTAKAAKEGA